jgi:hypothetical protein
MLILVSKGPLTTENASAVFDVTGIFKWIQSVFNSPDERLHVIAKSAIEAMLLYNQQRPLLIADIFQQCFYNEPNLAKGSFQAIVSVYTRSGELNFPYPKLMALGLFKLADSDIAVRKDAVKLLRCVETKFSIHFRLDDYEIAITNYLNLSYLQAQFSISEHLAISQPQLNHVMLSEFARQLDLVLNQDKGKVFSPMQPWVQRIQLSVKSVSDIEIVTDESYESLRVIFYVTVKYNAEHYLHLKELWRNILKTDPYRKFGVIFSFLVEICLELRNPAIVDQARAVVLFMSKEVSEDVILDAIVQELTPLSFMPLNVSRVIRRDERMKILDENRVSNILAKLPRNQAMSRGQVSIILLADVLPEFRKPLTAQYISLFLHVAVVNMDHKQALLVSQCRTLIARLVQMLISTKQKNNLKVFREHDFLSSLGSLGESGRLWNHDDVTPSQTLPNSIQTLNQFVHQLVVLFEHSFTDIRSIWGELALDWATTSLVRHISGRSYQVYRKLAPTLSKQMTIQLILRLVNLIADVSTDAQGIALEVLITIRSIIECCSAQEIMQHPQLFWCAVACLYTVHEHEYLEAIHIMSAIFDKLDVNNPEMRSHLLNHIPKQMKADYAGIQELLLRGLTSSTLAPNALALLNKTMSICKDPLIDSSPAGILFCLLANLPRLLKSFDNPRGDPGTVMVCQDLTEAIKHHNLHHFEKLLSMYTQGRWRSSDEFLQHFVTQITGQFFPVYETQTLLFLIGTLPNKLTWYRKNVLRILEAFVPFIDTSGGSQLFHVEEMLVPLYKLTQSEFSGEVLELIEAFMSLADKSISGTSVPGTAEMGTDPWGTKRFTTMMALEQESGWSVTHAGQWVKVTRSHLKGIVTHVSELPRVQTLRSSSLMDISENPPHTEDRTERSRGESKALISSFYELTQFFEGESAHPHHSQSENFEELNDIISETLGSAAEQSDGLQSLAQGDAPIPALPQSSPLFSMSDTFLLPSSTPISVPGEDPPINERRLTYENAMEQMVMEDGSTSSSDMLEAEIGKHILDNVSSGSDSLQDFSPSTEINP